MIMGNLSCVFFANVSVLVRCRGKLDVAEIATMLFTNMNRSVAHVMTELLLIREFDVAR